MYIDCAYIYFGVGVDDKVIQVVNKCLNEEILHIGEDFIVTSWRDKSDVRKDYDIDYDISHAKMLYSCFSIFKEVGCENTAFVSIGTYHSDTDMFLGLHYKVDNKIVIVCEQKSSLKRAKQLISMGYSIEDISTFNFHKRELYKVTVDKSRMCQAVYDKEFDNLGMSHEDNIGQYVMNNVKIYSYFYIYFGQKVDEYKLRCTLNRDISYYEHIQKVGDDYAIMSYDSVTDGIPLTYARHIAYPDDDWVISAGFNIISALGCEDTAFMTLGVLDEKTLCFDDKFFKVADYITVALYNDSDVDEYFELLSKNYKIQNVTVVDSHDEDKVLYQGKTPEEVKSFMNKLDLNENTSIIFNFYLDKPRMAQTWKPEYISHMKDRIKCINDLCKA